MKQQETNDQEQDKHAGGRPLKFETVEQLEQAIRAYFDSCDPHTQRRVVDCGINEQGETIWREREIMTEQKPYTVSGLARALGISRQTLINYGEREQFFDTVEAAKDRCHEYAESQLYGKASSGAAFSLKNNWGWKDRSEHALTDPDGNPVKAVVEFVGNGAAPTDSQN
jgi:DNA-binding XRE family transcriptional regulator